MCNSSTAFRRLVLNSSTCTEMVRPSFSGATFGMFGWSRTLLSSTYREKNMLILLFIICICVLHKTHHFAVIHSSTHRGEKICFCIHACLSWTWKKLRKESTKPTDHVYILCIKWQIQYDQSNQCKINTLLIITIHCMEFNWRMMMMMMYFVLYIYKKYIYISLEMCTSRFIMSHNSQMINFPL